MLSVEASHEAIVHVVEHSINELDIIHVLLLEEELFVAGNAWNCESSYYEIFHF